jgi:hypothetical protein
MIFQKKKRGFLRNREAVLGLPMRLTVSLIIGTMVLLSILSWVLNPCLFPERMVVSVSPMITILSDDGPENVTFIVHVNDTKGKPLCGASVIISGLCGAGAGFSDAHGKVLVQMQIHLNNGSYEGYLDIVVKSTCFVPFEHEKMIKIVRGYE